MARRCLVISAFLPRADDAGHRKRTFESCLLLSDLGFDLTLLHLAFEGDWYWRRQKVDHAELSRCGVHEYLEFNASHFVGTAPGASDGVHLLDEWCSTDLLSYITNHLKHNFYEVVIVHNVWLSKLFDLFHAATICIIETHDLFSARIEEFKKISVPPDFFTCSEQDEVFGLNRADIVIAIKNNDAEWMRQRGVSAKILTVTPRPELNKYSSRNDYLYSDKIVFGFIGSAHLFNVFSLIAFLKLLKTKLLNNPVAIEIRIAGKVCDQISVDQYPFVQRLGFISSLPDFYSSVDFIFTPLDFGTGLKLKVAESIDYGVPVLSTKHSAEGVALDESLVVNRADELCDLLIEITATRPPYQQYLTKITQSKRLALTQYAESKVNLQSTLIESNKSFMLAYPELLFSQNHPLFAAAIALLRLLSGQGRVWALCRQTEIQILNRALSKMPATVELLVLEQYPEDGHAYSLANFQSDFKDTAAASVFICSKKNSSAPFAKAEFYDNFAEMEACEVNSETSSRFVNIRTNEKFYLPLYNESTLWDPTITRPMTPDYSKTTLLLEISEAIAVNLRTYLNQFHPEVDLYVVADDGEKMSEILHAICVGRLGGTLLVQVRASRFVSSVCQYLKVFGYRVHLFRGFPIDEGDTCDFASSAWMSEQGMQTRALQKLFSVEST